MIIGILSTLAACLCWGFVFVVPQMLKGFSPLEISLGRFLVYGLISFGLLLWKKRSLLNISYFPLWRRATWYGFLSTIFCFSGMVIGVQYANAAVTALIFATSPITIAILGNLRKKEFAFDRLLLPILLMAMGIILANLNAFAYDEHPLDRYIFGLISAVLGLFSWSWFVVINSAFLENQKQIFSHDWSLMMGSATLVLVCLLIGAMPFYTPMIERFYILDEKMISFIWGSLVLGAISTSCAFLFWNYGSKRLPVAISGQLMIFEVIFGLILYYFFAQKAPTHFELLGILFMIAGVIIGCKKLAKLTKIHDSVPV